MSIKKKDKEKKKNKDKNKKNDMNIFDESDKNFGSVFGGLKDVFFNYGRNVTKLPWKDMPKEGIFLILFTLAFMVISIVIRIKISKGGGLF